MTTEKRKHLREPGNSRATVIHIPNHEPIMCTVTDLSEVGAGLTVASAERIPSSFQLEVKNAPKIYACRVIWKQDHRMGVEFLPDAEPEHDGSKQ